jgi:hypothetical protein
MAVLALLVAAIQAIVLVGALIYARRQVAEAKSTREATIRPFIVVDFDVDRPPVINLSIANIGPVMATNVRFAFDLMGTPEPPHHLTAGSGFARPA